MGSAPNPDTEELLERAGVGDVMARQALLTRHQSRLRKMVAIRMDRRLTARFDPSDVVQETLVVAARLIDEYLRLRPMPFYPWLRKLACQRLVDLNRRHIRARRRSVAREEVWQLGLPDRSTRELASRLVSSGTSPSGHLIRAEALEHVRSALTKLPPRDCEVLVLRHLEQLSTDEAAAVLEISVGALKTRHVRALVRLRRLLETEQQG